MPCGLSRVAGTTSLVRVIYVDGSALEQFLPGGRFHADWTAWVIPRINDIVTTQVALTELRHTVELLPRDAKRHAFGVLEQVKGRVAVIRLSDDMMSVSTYAASVLTPFAALQLGAAVAHPDVDAIATYDRAMASAAAIYGLAVVSPGQARGWHNGSAAS